MKKSQLKMCVDIIVAGVSTWYTEVLIIAGKVSICGNFEIINRFFSLESC